MGVTALAERALIALVQAATEVAEASNSVVRSAGLSPSQYNVLRILRGAGDEGLTRNEIATRMVTRDPDMTRLLGGLETRDLVTTWPSETDARQRLSATTSDGRSLLEELDPLVTAAAQRSMAGLSGVQLEHLISLLTKLTAREA